jgi:hypothetical protein
MGILDQQNQCEMPMKRVTANSINQILEAVRKNDLEQIQAYLQAGGDVNACDSKGITPLMVAVKQVEAFDMIRCLVEAGAAIDACDKTGRSVVERIPIPPEPPEAWENGHEAWMHCDELFVIRYLLDQQRLRKKPIS